ncbi:imidazole glycerol phosphate synthase subunit HisH [Bdellovibrio sp. HCB337]|uniref:imidazole glycerol phosphate synthase subunit HisH n=1 Tax=Bdellovibrio sp. HCB337 TaxID=3394358 RepID=UPI0039A59BCF
MKKVVIVDYGVGNLFSIKQALMASGVTPIVSSDKNVIASADGVLLPGVGAFGDAMNRLREQGLVDVLRHEALAGKPFLGVCLGLQLMFSKSDEFGSHEGLGILPGVVRKFPSSFDGQELSVPFIGWNFLETQKEDSFIAGLGPESKLFLVHSFYVQPEDPSCVISTCRYHNFQYPVVLRRGNVFGVQGHPEKSGLDGLKIYANWLNNL